MTDVICLAASERLCVVFERSGERWGHRIELTLADRSPFALISDEGGPQDAWPPSPPLQSLERQKLPDGREIAFLVGMAGSSHWSAAIEARRDTAEIVFDIACRCTTRPNRIGSGYRIELPFDAKADDLAAHVCIQQSTDGCQALLTCDDRQIAVRVELSDVTPPCTIRWRYAIR